MVIVMMFLFGMRDEYLYEPEFSAVSTFSIQPIGKLDASVQNWYIATQLTLDSVFPIVYGLFFFAVIGAFVPERFQGVFYGLVLILIGTDYAENSLQVVYLSIFRYRAIAILADATTFLKFFWVGLILGAFVARFLCRIPMLIGEGEFGSTVTRPLDHLVRARFPLCFIVFLAVWAPLAARVPGIRAITANMLLLNSYEQIGLLSCINTLAIIFAIAMLRAVWQHIELNVVKSATYQSGPWMRWHYLLVFVLNLITPLAAFHFSVVEMSIVVNGALSLIYLEALLVTCLGFLIAFLMIYVFGILIGYAIGQTKGENNFFPVEDRDQRARLWDLRDRGATHFGVQMMLYFIVLSFLFFVVFNRHEKALTWLSVPSLLIMFVWLILTITTRLSVWFDAARIPTTIPLLIVVVLTRYLANSESLPVLEHPNPHSSTNESLSQFRASNFAFRSSTREYFELQDRFDLPETSDDEKNQILKNLSLAEEKVSKAKKEQDTAREQMGENVWKSIESRLKPINERKVAMAKALAPQGNQKPLEKTTLVLVTCPGGGIHAAAWASMVLEKLDQRYIDFADSICMISGVSGGSVGTVFFAKNRYLENDNQNKVHISNAWMQATKSSLEAIGAGLAFHDIPASFIPGWYGQDRGLRLEAEWGLRLSDGASSRTLSDWGEFALKGKMPIVILNSTDAVSGRRILFSTLPIPPRASLDSRVGRPWDYRELIDYQKYDMNIETAARASATFPYVSPFASPEQASDIGKQVAVCDGGFVDNEGIVTAIDWLDFVVKKASEQTKAKKEVPFQRILLLRIQPSSDIEVDNVDSNRWSAQSQFRWLTGPVEALASMRTTSQVERGLLESDLATAYIDTPWWIEKTSTQPSTDTTTLLDPDPSKLIAKEKSDRYRLDIHTSDLQTKLRMNQTARKNQSSKGNPKSNNGQSQADKLNLKSQYLVRDPSKTPQVPVLVCNITFEHPEPTEPIPLNWKLSPRQLTWYENAWNVMIDASSNQAKEDNSKSQSALQVLNDHFELREPVGKDIPGAQ